MKKIAILYICTGQYSVFWKDFFLSFEEKFLNNTEIHYFVFTDVKYIYNENKCSRIHRIYSDPLPWPLPTLLKFNEFLKIEENLKAFDYIFQSNANIVCSNEVFEKDFLPDSKLGEELIFVLHPGYRNKRTIYSPFERNSKSKAFVPYSNKKQYVFGAMNGGIASSYITMIRDLSEKINEDLKKNIIAKWHDESHINHYVYTHDNIKILSPSYCYPVGLEIPEKPLISGVSKATKFDVNTFKGNYQVERKNFEKLLYYLKVICIFQIMPNISLIKEKIMNCYNKS